MQAGCLRRNEDHLAAVEGLHGAVGASVDVGLQTVGGDEKGGGGEGGVKGGDCMRRKARLSRVVCRRRVR